MALYDSASLLALFNEKAGRPASDAVTDASKYRQLSTSQNRVIAKIGIIAPKSLYPKVAYGSIPALVTTDGQVFTFGTDANGFPIYPMGKAGVYASLGDIPTNPWLEGRDFISEGTQIRIPNNGTYSGTLYYYAVTNPPDISASVEPSIFPEAARELIVIDAVRQFASNFARQPDLAAMMAAEWADAWPVWCLAWKTQFKSGGALVVQFGGTTFSGSGSSSGGSGSNDTYFSQDFFG
jgi:hypothetical protein